MSGFSSAVKLLAQDINVRVVILCTQTEEPLLTFQLAVNMVLRQQAAAAWKHRKTLLMEQNTSQQQYLQPHSTQDYLVCSFLDLLFISSCNCYSLYGHLVYYPKKYKLLVIMVAEKSKQNVFQLVKQFIFFTIHLEKS